MNKWTMSGQVADIILDSIKRKITKVYGGTFPVSMFPHWEPGLPNVLVGEAAQRRRGPSGNIYHLSATGLTWGKVLSMLSTIGLIKAALLTL